MKLGYVLLGSMMVLINSACTEKSAKPPVTVNHNDSGDNNQTRQSTNAPDSKPVVVDFPFVIKDLGLLIHPIAPIPIDLPHLAILQGLII